MKLQIENVTKRFGDRCVLDGVSFAANSGPVGLLGRNGAGKTTLMRIMMNILQPDSGRLLLDGSPISGQSRRLGYLPEERGLYIRTPVEDQLVYIARLKGVPRAEAQDAARRWLGRLGIEQYRRSHPQALSKGNQQRVQLAMALMNDPDVVILDEPFSGLDPVGAKELRSVIEELNGAGKLIIVSSHQMSAVESVCRSVVMLRQGRVVLDSPLDELRGMGEAGRVRLHTADDTAAAGVAARFGTVSRDGEGLTIDLSRAQDRPALLAALVNEGADVRLFEADSASLEEVFVRLCGDGSHAGGEFSTQEVNQSE